MRARLPGRRAPTSDIARPGHVPPGRPALQSRDGASGGDRRIGSRQRCGPSVRAPAGRCRSATRRSSRITAADGVAAVRPGAPHTVQAHAYMSRNHVELTTRLPDVAEALVAAGVQTLDICADLPPHLYDGGRHDDHEFRMFQSRRLTFDRVLVSALLDESGVTVRPVRASGLVLEDGDPPRVTGVRLGDGEVLPADVVLDAGGRRSPVPGWLRQAGVVEDLATSECGVHYYGRHYRIGPGERPDLNAGFASVTIAPRVSAFFFIGDQDTAMLALAAYGEDPLLKSLRHEEALVGVARAIPGISPWLEVSEPITPVFSMGAVRNGLRRMTARPRRTRPAPRRRLAGGDQPDAGARDRDGPVRHRGARRPAGRRPRSGGGHAAPRRLGGSGPVGLLARVLRAGRRRERRRARPVKGEDLPPNAPLIELPDDAPWAEQLNRAAERDPDVFRAVMRCFGMLDDERAIAAPAMLDRIRDLAGADPDERADAPPDPMP